MIGLLVFALIAAGMAAVVFAALWRFEADRAARFASDRDVVEDLFFEASAEIARRDEPHEALAIARRNALEAVQS